jgi:hypothetical protein
MNSRLQHLAAFCAAVLTASATFRSSAEESEPSSLASASPGEKSYTGIVSTFDQDQHVMKVKSWTMLHKTFNLGQRCTFVLSGHTTGTLNDLRPGEKITVRYQNVHGVRIADRIQQVPVRFEGKVVAIDPIAHQIVVHQRGLDKAMVIAPGCRIVRLNQQPGALPDIRLGDHITVTYEMPDDVPTAREIAQTSMEFVGTLTAIDTAAHTAKASSAFSNRKFVIGNHCSIVLASRPNARLNDLKPDDKLTFSYDEINGVNVINRIGSAPSAMDNMVYTVPPSGY